MGIVALLGLVAIFGPLIAPKSPTAFVGLPYGHASSSSLLGTDYLGRDVLSRFLSGGRTVLGLAVATTALGVVTGIAIGLFAAYTRSWADNVVMRAMDVLMAFPPVIFALLVVSTNGLK